MTEYIDSHAHLSAADLSNPGQNSGITVVDTGIDYESSAAAVENSENPGVYATAGIHPTKIFSSPDVEKTKDLVRSEESLVAVGEIGVDFHHVKSNERRQKSKEIFSEFVDLAEEQQMPVVVHSRDAEKPVMSILEGFSQDVYMHCFNGNMEITQEAVNRGYFIGVTPQINYSDRVRNIVEEAGLSNIVLETDSPYIADRPSDVSAVASEIAKVVGEPEQRVVSKSLENARNLFSISL